MKTSFYSCLILMVSVIGCKKRLEPNAYVQWFKTSEENLSACTTEDYIYEARYMSPEVSALLEFGADKDSLRKYGSEFKQWSNFNLKVFSKEKSEDVLKYKIAGETEYYERLQYFISYMNNDVVAINSKNDTIPCAFHHFERTYKITPFANILLSFEGDIGDIDKILVKLPFDDKAAAIKINKASYPELKL